jgi:O-antigen biosynthesis protein
MSAPRFSILTPVYRPPTKALRSMLGSVTAQTLGDWEHCLVDDHSDDPKVDAILDEAADRDPRVRVERRERQGGIVAATNDALAMASGDFVAFLDNDDELNTRALEAMAAAIEANPDADYLYSDQDMIDERRRHSNPFIKPGWSPDRLAAQMYMAHFRVIRRSLIEALGGLRDGFDGAQDWDLALRLSERSERIVHVPEILYHWRTLASSVADSPEVKPWAHEASRKAVSEHAKRLGVQAGPEPVPDFAGHYWLRPKLTETPLVSIVIPTGGRAGAEESGPLVVNCVRSIVERTTYESFELVVVIDDGAPGEVATELERLAGDRLRLIPFSEEFNFSAKVNRGVEASRGEQVLLLNDDIEVLPSGWRPVRNGGKGGLPRWDTETGGGRRIWLESLLAYTLQEGVGAAGAKLYFPDGHLQHAGIIATGGLVGHPYYGFPGDNVGYMGCLMLAANFLAVTGACLMTPRRAFESVGGFDTELPLNYNDVDYCLKLHRAGLRSVMVPHAELLHHESVSRGDEPPSAVEIEALRSRWGKLLENDPYYSRAFVDGNFGLLIMNPKGEFVDRGRIYAYYREGGVGLVLKRAFNRLRHLRRRAAVALQRR